MHICSINMKSIFKLGDKIQFTKVIGLSDLAEFESGSVHKVYGTFALGRDAEWSSRLFVLEMKEDDEEGIGTFLNITHKSCSQILQNNSIARSKKRQNHRNKISLVLFKRFPMSEVFW